MIPEKRARRMMRKSATRLMELADKVWWIEMHVEHDMSKKYNYEKVEVNINGFGKPTDPMMPVLDYYTYQTYYSSIFPITAKAVRMIWAMKVQQNEEATNG